MFFDLCLGGLVLHAAPAVRLTLRRHALSLQVRLQLDRAGALQARVRLLVHALLRDAQHQVVVALLPRVLALRDDVRALALLVAPVLQPTRLRAPERVYLQVLVLPEVGQT